MKYLKLVRDYVPEIILKEGKTPLTHIADAEEYSLRLNEKLIEEVQEYLQSNNPEELTDILEVLISLAAVQGLSLEQLSSLREKKFKERGGFSKRIILDEVK